MALTQGPDSGAIPPAEGVRRSWDEVPAPIRRAVEHELDAPVVRAISQTGGFSPGVAARLETSDGGRVFVKAVASQPNRQSPEMHRREARIAGALPADAPAPRLWWTFDDGDWVVLVFEDIDGTTPQTPWRADELQRVLDAVTELASTLTPSPIAVERAAELPVLPPDQWRALQDGEDGERIAPGWRDRLPELVALEAAWPAASHGDSLVHLDLRADNLLLTNDRVYVVDWPWATIGAPWLDLVALLPSVAMQGGPPPETIWQAHPLSAGVDDDAVNSFLAALTGMFTRQSMLPPSPGLPTLRAFQDAQSRPAREWLAQRLGWTDVAT